MLLWIENTTNNNNEKLKKQVAVEDGYRLKKKKQGIGFFALLMGACFSWTIVYCNQRSRIHPQSSRKNFVVLERLYWGRIAIVLAWCTQKWIMTTKICWYDREARNRQKWRSKWNNLSFWFRSKEFFFSVILILVDYSLRSSRAVLFWRALIFTTQLLGVLAKTNTKATCGWLQKVVF